MSDNEYQGPISVFVFLLCLNLLFWLIIACWRFCSLITIRTFSLNRLMGQFQNLRYYLQRRLFRRRVTRITNLNNLNGISNRNLDLNSDLPPTYEEALKYPYVSTICSNVAIDNNATIIDMSESISNLDNLDLIDQLENRQSSILLCTGNCNCLNHLRQNITDHNAIVNLGGTQMHESSSTATTSTIDSNLNTFSTIIEDETPTSTNRNLIVETNLTTFPPKRKSNLYRESANQERNSRSNQESNQTASDREPTDQQVLNVSTLEMVRRSSTFNDLQSYLKNIHR